MRIYYDYENTFFDENNRSLGNCITISENNKNIIMNFV